MKPIIWIDFLTWLSLSKDMTINHWVIIEVCVFMNVSLNILTGWWDFSIISPRRDLIDGSLWWSDMIGFSFVASRQVIFNYLPRLLLLLSCSLFCSHFLGEFSLTDGFKYPGVSRLSTGTKISLITSFAQSCHRNSLTFENWWAGKHLFPSPHTEGKHYEDGRHPWTSNLQLIWFI